MRKAISIAVMVLATACGGKKDECRVTSVGACASAPGASCGATLSCGSKAYELKCTPPATTDQKQVDCQCVDGGVIGKTVQLAFPLNATAQAVQGACGWK